MFAKTTFLGSWDFRKKRSKKVQRPQNIFFSEGGGWTIDFLKFCFWGYQRVFWVPLGGDDGYSSVVLHAAALNHKVAGSNPTPRGGEINHKSGRSIINQWINGIKLGEMSKKRQNGPTAPKPIFYGTPPPYKALWARWTQNRKRSKKVQKGPAAPKPIF